MSYKTHSTYRPPDPDPSDLYLAMLRRRAGIGRCLDGHHDEQAATGNQVIYLPYGRRLNTGDRFCARCNLPLPAMCSCCRRPFNDDLPIVLLHTGRAWCQLCAPADDDIKLGHPRGPCPHQETP